MFPARPHQIHGLFLGWTNLGNVQPPFFTWSNHASLTWGNIEPWHEPWSTDWLYDLWSLKTRKWPPQITTGQYFIPPRICSKNTIFGRPVRFGTPPQPAPQKNAQAPSGWKTAWERLERSLHRVAAVWRSRAALKNTVKFHDFGNFWGVKTWPI